MNEEFEKWWERGQSVYWNGGDIADIAEAAWNAATERCLRILQETDFGRYTEIGERIVAAIREGER